MQEKTIVIFGDSLYHEVSNSDYFKNYNIIMVNKLFSVGKLSREGIVYTQGFLDLINSEIGYDLENFDFYELDSQLDNINRNVDILTTKSQVDSFLMFLYVVSYFKEKNVQIKVYFSDEGAGNYYSPSCMNSDEIIKLMDNGHILTDEEKEQMCQEWQVIISSASDMRVIDNGKVVCTGYEYYDSFILERLKTLGEVSVGEFGANIMRDVHVYDTVVTFFINRLIDRGKIKVVDRKKRLWQSIVVSA